MNSHPEGDEETSSDEENFDKSPSLDEEEDLDESPSLEESEDMDESRSLSEEEEDLTPLPYQNEAEKRLYHNELERRRREVLSVTFKEVTQLCMPYISKKGSKRSSRKVILAKVADYIKKQPDLQLIRMHIQQATEMNEVLRRHIEEFDEAEKNGDIKAMERLSKFVPPPLPHPDEIFGVSEDEVTETEAPPALTRKKQKRSRRR